VKAGRALQSYNSANVSGSNLALAYYFRSSSQISVELSRLEHWGMALKLVLVNVALAPHGVGESSLNSCLGVGSVKVKLAE
jgi:hypothetical protein